MAIAMVCSGITRTSVVDAAFEGEKLFSRLFLNLHRNALSRN